MKKSNAPVKTEPPVDSKGAPMHDLEFPVEPEFFSAPPNLPPEVMLRRIEEHLLWRKMSPGEKRLRMEARADVEFVL